MKTQTFGVELETTGLGRGRTARVLAAHFGTTAQHISAAGRRSNARRTALRKTSSDTTPVPKAFTSTLTGSALPMA